MEENVLKDFETFNEFPDKHLKVNENSNCYLVNKDGKNYVAKKKLDSVTILEILGSQKILTVKSYYDITTGEFIVNTRCISDIEGVSKEYIGMEENIEINSLRKVLNIGEKEVCYLSKEDVNELLNLKKDSNVKTYILKPKK